MRISPASRTDTKWVTFFLAGECFALPIDSVQEVLMPQALAAVPLAPPHIAGLLNLRGHIMTTVDLRRQLGSALTTIVSGGLIVIHTSEETLAVLVDEIGDVVEVLPEWWKPAPDTLGATHRRFISAVYPGNKFMILRMSTESLIGPPGGVP